MSQTREQIIAFLIAKDDVNVQLIADLNKQIADLTKQLEGDKDLSKPVE